jgi:hypothetical protein
MHTLSDAQVKLDGLIDQGKSNVEHCLADIQKEFAIRKDFIVKPQALDFDANSEGLSIGVQNQDQLSLTEYSTSQLCQRAQVPKKFLDKVIQFEDYPLAENILSKMLANTSSDGIMIRQVGAVAKGILSPSYRRMDAGPIFESFVAKAINAGLVPYQGFNTEYRYQLRFLYPKIFQPTENEYIIYGISLTTSDYGSGALDLSLMALRIWCTNLMIGYDMFRKVHLGKRFNSQDDYLELSNKTHQLDTATIASAIQDTVGQSLKHFNILDEQIKDASTRDVNSINVLEGLRKQGMSKEISEQVKTLYNQESIVELLPANKSAWRLSNAIALVAQEKGIPVDKRIDLEGMAMKVLMTK